MQLKNFLQANGGIERLQYIGIVSGPPHRPTWASTAYSRSDVAPYGTCLHLPLVDGIPYSEGHSGEKGEAHENAARDCYLTLRTRPDRLAYEGDNGIRGANTTLRTKL